MAKMNSSIRKQHGSIHRIREFELEKVNLSDEFDILQIVGEGWFGKILLVEHRATDTEMVLKALPKPYVSLRDFYREFHYSLHLGAHKNIITTYDVAFETAGFYVFTQEYAPLGDLTSNVSDIGIGETHTKRVAKQIASALDYIHSKDLVHRDVKLDNVLVCRSDFSRVKLCDFGETRKAYSYVQRRNEWLPYSPPEVLQINTDQTYRTVPTHDFWQFGIVLFVCLTGCLPWQKAALDDPRYVRYLVWQSSNMMIPIKRTPKLFKLLTNRACKLFRKFLEPMPERRPKNLSDLNKFLDDRWLAKSAEKDMIANEPDELCASMYSFHSSPEEKNKLLYALTQHGIETTVDRVAKKKRIRDWIQESVIQEVDEEEEEEKDSEENPQTRRQAVVGHVSSVRAEEKAARKEIVTTVKDASNKHINPRTGRVQQGPSEMGHNNNNNQESLRRSDMKSLETGVDNTNYEYGSRRSTKLIDVGSQTSSESQKQLEAANNLQTGISEQTVSRDNAETSKHTQTVPLNSYTNNFNGNANIYKPEISIDRTDSTSRGLISAFNSLVTIAAPKSHLQSLQKHRSFESNHQHTQRDLSQPRYSYNQRHNTTALSKQQISRSANNFSNIINDSGYGSLDKLRNVDRNIIISSPTLPKRSTVVNNNGINGVSHTQHQGNSSCHSDSGDSPSGSNGFVNLTGITSSETNRSNDKLASRFAYNSPISTKDTAYDQIRTRERARNRK